MGCPDGWIQKEGVRANLKSEEIVHRLLQRKLQRGPRYAREPICSPWLTSRSATAPSPEDSSLMNPTKAREIVPAVSSAQCNIHDSNAQLVIDTFCR